MATKLPVPQKRMFSDVFICKNCSQKIRSQSVRIIASKVKCSKCGKKSFRPIRKKK